MKTPRISLKQTILAFICRLLAGDKHEQRATNLLPERNRIKGLRLYLYRYFDHLRYVEGQKLVKKYKTHTFKPYFRKMNAQDYIKIGAKGVVFISGARFYITNKKKS